MSGILSIMNATAMPITVSMTHFEGLEQDGGDRARSIEQVDYSIMNARVRYASTHFGEQQRLAKLIALPS